MHIPVARLLHLHNLSTLSLNIVPATDESGLNMEVAVKPVKEEKVVNTEGPATEGHGKVRMGAMSPSFPVVCDRPASLADSGRVRTGAMSPSFPLSRPR